MPRSGHGLSPGLLAVLGLLMTLNPVTASIYLPALGAIADDLGVSIAVVQLALTGYYLGVAVGVMFGGPLTDALGRRSVLLVGLGVLAAATVAVALAPAAPILIGARVLQGLGSSTAIVVVRAIVSDVARGRQAARAFSVLMGILAAGPLVAPLLGTALLQLGGWRTIFVGLLVVIVVYLVVAGMTVPETLPVARRAPLRLAPLLRNYRRLLGDVPFAGDAAAVALAFGALSVHVSASSFIAQEVLGTGTWGYAILYACYAVAVMGGSWLNAPLAGRFGPRRMLLAGQGVALAAAVAFVVVAAGRPTIVGYLVVVMIGSAAISSVLANGTALGMSRATFAAGTGAALMGCLQFTFSAVVSPLGGVAGSHTALPTALVMAGCLVASIGAGVVAAASVRRARRRARAGVTDVQS